MVVHSVVVHGVVHGAYRGDWSIVWRIGKENGNTITI